MLAETKKKEQKRKGDIISRKTNNIEGIDKQLFVYLSTSDNNKN